MWLAKVATIVIHRTSQGVSQKFLIWAVRPKLGFSELWSREFEVLL